jgi:hypothetical protein
VLCICLALGGCGSGAPAGTKVVGQTDGYVSDGDATTIPNPEKYNSPTGGRATDGQAFAFSGPPAFNKLSGGAYAIPGPTVTSSVNAGSNNKATSTFEITGLLAALFPKTVTYTIDTPVAAFCTGGQGEVFGMASVTDNRAGKLIDSFDYSYKFNPNPANPTTECDVLRTAKGARTTTTIPNGGIYNGHETGQFAALVSGDYTFIFEMNLKAEPDGKTTLSATSTIDAK